MIYRYYVSFIVPNPFGVGFAVIEFKKKIDSLEDIEEIKSNIEIQHPDNTGITVMYYQLMAEIPAKFDISEVA